MPLTVKQLKAYPPEATRTKFPNATLDGFADVAQGRDGPFKLHYKIYGQGPNKIMWISGHGAGLEDWVDIVKEFGGLRNTDKYTSLIFEARGIGRSEAPWSLVSMKDLVQDTKDLLDHVGWTEDKNVNIFGHSMGGMLAMQFAITHPNLLKTLCLTSTTTNWLGTLSLWSATKTTVSQLIPRSADIRLNETKTQLFSTSWLSSPDPTGKFPTNGDAWAARSLSGSVHYKGAILTAPATVMHKVASDTCREVARQLGKGKVLILHGTEDRMIPVAVAEEMGKEFGAREMGVRVVLLERAGHMPVLERFADVVELVEGLVCEADVHGGDEEWLSVR